MSNSFYVSIHSYRMIRQLEGDEKGNQGCRKLRLYWTVLRKSNLVGTQNLAQDSTNPWNIWGVSWLVIAHSHMVGMDSAVSQRTLWVHLE